MMSSHISLAVISWFAGPLPVMSSQISLAVISWFAGPLP